jgi:membrane-bound serine protease (ClpP class)
MTRRAVSLRPIASFAGLCCLALVALSLLVASPRASAQRPHLDLVTFQRDVDPASARFLTDAIDTAQDDGSALLLIDLDTPGGDLDSMKAIVQKELASTVPIVVYVSPSGGRAGSAGTFVALAAPIVAMAPDTRIGAASPVDSSGADIPATEDRKLKNDLEAQVRGIQTSYGRNTDDAIQTVETATSYSDAEALGDNLVNLGADSQNDLLRKLDGYAGHFSSGAAFALHTAGLTINELQPTLANQLETALFDPTLLFILFIIAAICIYLELAHPGAIVPGTIGALALLLFLFASQSINPNWTGLLLMLLAIVLLAIDVRVPTHGVLTVGALVALVAGSLIFFDSGTQTGGAGVDPLVILGAAVAMGLCSLVVILYAVRSKGGPKISGAEGLLGTTATVIEPIGPGNAPGRVRVLGEDWSARLGFRAAASNARFEENTPMRVKKVEGLTLIVEPLPAGRG